MKRALMCVGLCALLGCGDDPPVASGAPGSSFGFDADSKAEVCDSAPIPADVWSAVGLVSCLPKLGIGQDPSLFEVRIAAEPLGPLSGDTAFEVRAQVVNREEVAEIVAQTVAARWVITEASVELDQLNGSDPTALAVSVPCVVDYAVDTDENGRPGPTALTTGIDTAIWTVSDDSITVEATDMTFHITPRLGVKPLPFSTKGPESDCWWIDVPRLTFAVDASVTTAP